jgi:hypothetical protein
MTVLEIMNTKLCLNCGSLYCDSASCPRCASGVWIWLSKWVPTMEENNNVNA